MRNDSGFTLLEVLIALTIMSIAFAAILMVESGSIESSIKTKNMVIVQMLARNQMIETEKKIENKTFTEIKKEESGEFPEPYKEFKWKMTVKEIEFPDLSLLLSKGGGTGTDSPSSTSSNQQPGESASGRGASGTAWMAEQITKKVSEYLSKAVREVTVTISWKKGSGEQSFSLTHFWISFNEPIRIL